MNDDGKVTNSLRGSGLSELELLLKQKTFTRYAFDWIFIFFVLFNLFMEYVIVVCLNTCELHDVGSHIKCVM